MATTKKRHQVTLGDKLYNHLLNQSKEKQISMSQLMLDLIKTGLEFNEDYELSMIADEAWEQCKDLPTTPAEEVWKECGLA